MCLYICIYTHIYIFEETAAIVSSELLTARGGEIHIDIYMYIYIYTYIYVYIYIYIYIYI
jgi:hypothetical protein